MFIEKKSTAPNSAKVSIATNDKPAIIAGLADGKIILRNTFNFEKPNLKIAQITYDRITFSKFLAKNDARMKFFFKYSVSMIISQIPMSEKWL